MMLKQIRYMKRIQTILTIAMLLMSAFSDCLAQNTGNGDTLYVNTKSSDESAKYLLDDVNKMTFSSKGIQLWSTSWPTEYPYGNVENLSFISNIRTFAMGDVNIDGYVNVSDVMQVVNHILGNTPDPFDENAADVNGDKKITISDAVGIVNIVLGNTQ